MSERTPPQPSPLPPTGHGRGNGISVASSMIEVTAHHDPNEPDDWCQVCGAPLPLDCLWGVRKYCSKRCCQADQYREPNEQKQARRRRQTRRRRFGRTCAHCGGGIPLTRDLKAKFCSPECHARANDQAKRERRKPQSERTCEGCGGHIPQDKRADAHFCSRECKARTMHREYNRRYKRRRRGRPAETEHEARHHDQPDP